METKKLSVNSPLFTCKNLCLKSLFCQLECLGCTPQRAARYSYVPDWMLFYHGSHWDVFVSYLAHCFTFVLDWLAQLTTYKDVESDVRYRDVGHCLINCLLIGTNQMVCYLRAEGPKCLSGFRSGASGLTWHHTLLTLPPPQCPCVPSLSPYLPAPFCSGVVEYV